MYSAENWYLLLFGKMFGVFWIFRCQAVLRVVAVDFKRQLATGKFDFEDFEDTKLRVRLRWNNGFS